VDALTSRTTLLRFTIRWIKAQLVIPTQGGTLGHDAEQKRKHAGPHDIVGHAHAST
jgi:hypothetical protein